MSMHAFFPAHRGRERQGAEKKGDRDMRERYRRERDGERNRGRRERNRDRRERDGERNRDRRERKINRERKGETSDYCFFFCWTCFLFTVVIVM